MPSPEILDFGRLLTPIGGDSPAGRDLRTDTTPNSIYYRVKGARGEARAAERQAEVDGDSSRADWRPILKLAPDVIAEQSKDLEITAYLIEALVRHHGFAGLRDGFRLASELVEQFWDGLYPMPDEDGLETRTAPLTGLNGEEAEGTLIRPIESVKVTEGKSAGPFSYGHYRQAAELAGLELEKREQRLAQGAVSMEQFERAVAESSTEFYQNLVDDLSAALDEFGRLGERLEAQCGSRAPPTSNIRVGLSDIRDAVQIFARNKLPIPSEGEVAGEGAEAGAEVAAGAVGALRSREDAFRTLGQVADFFRRAEPHSPISYALERVVRWGRTPLPELLAELIPEDSARSEIFKVVGIPPPAVGSS